MLLHAAAVHALALTLASRASFALRYSRRHAGIFGAHEAIGSGVACAPRPIAGITVGRGDSTGPLGPREPNRSRRDRSDFKRAEAVPNGRYGEPGPRNPPEHRTERARGPSFRGHVVRCRAPRRSGGHLERKRRSANDHAPLGPRVRSFQRATISAQSIPRHRRASTFAGQLRFGRRAALTIRAVRARRAAPASISGHRELATGMTH